jgi:hypothetical protein
MRKLSRGPEPETNTPERRRNKRPAIVAGAAAAAASCLLAASCTPSKAPAQSNAPTSSSSRSLSPETQAQHYVSSVALFLAQNAIQGLREPGSIAAYSPGSFQYGSGCSNKNKSYTVLFTFHTPKGDGENAKAIARDVRPDDVEDIDLQEKPAKYVSSPIDNEYTLEAPNDPLDPTNRVWSANYSGDYTTYQEDTTDLSLGNPLTTATLILKGGLGIDGQVVSGLENFFTYAAGGCNAAAAQ